MEFIGWDDQGRQLFAAEKRCPIHNKGLLELYQSNVPGCSRHSGNQDKHYTERSPRLLAAYEAARSARFEHGEIPRVPRGKPRKQ